MTRDFAKGCIGLVDQEIARYVTRCELTQKLEKCTMGAMLRTDVRGIYKRWTKVGHEESYILQGPIGEHLLMMMMGSVMAIKTILRKTWQ